MQLTHKSVHLDDRLPRGDGIRRSDCDCCVEDEHRPWTVVGDREVQTLCTANGGNRCGLSFRVQEVSSG